MFEFGITAEFFALARPELDFVPYRFAVAAADPPPLRGLGGIRVDVDGGLELLREANLIVVPGWRDLDETPRPEITRALARRGGARRAGRLDLLRRLPARPCRPARRPPRHHALAPYRTARARCSRPSRVEPDVLYVDEGEVMTSAGSAAGIDLMLHLVRKDYGPHVANMFARRMVVPPHRDGGQSQFVVQPIAVRTNDRIASVADWMAGNLRDAITIEALADRAAMSVRTFTRRFRAATGTAPIEWLIRLRVRRAQDLLETTDAPIDQVAHEAGFGAPETLRHHFRKVVGTSPSAWRNVVPREGRAGRQKRKPAPRGRRLKSARSDSVGSGARVEHRHRAAVLRPARDVVADRDRTLLAVGDRAHAVGLDAARGQIVAHRLGAPGAERDVVFARAALVGMALDREGIAVVAAEPLRLLVEGRDRLRGQLREVRLEEHAVADIDDEVLRAAGRRAAGKAAHWRRSSVGLLAQAASERPATIIAANFARAHANASHCHFPVPPYPH